MLDKNLLGLIAEQRPQMNEDLCDGIVLPQLENCEQYINDVMRCAAESFPEGLRYDGMVRCNPYEEYREITKQTKLKRSFELSRSDVYMVKLLFSYKGETLRPRYIFLPFASSGGLFHLKGTQYKISPVIGGRAFNMEKGGIFMWTPRAKIIFEKAACSFILNNRVDHAFIVHLPKLFNLKQGEENRHYATTVHYMLAEYGLQGMMRRYFNTEVAVGGPEIDELLATGEWFVYRSRQLPPPGKRKTSYVPSNIRIAVPKDKWDKKLNGIIGAIFYVIDMCSEAIQPEDMDEPELWLRLLSRFIFRTIDSEKKVFDSMLEHQDSIRHYMDPITKRILAKTGILCNDTYDLFHYINLNFVDMAIHQDVGSMYHKELSTEKHLLYNITHNIFSLLFNLKKLSGDRVSGDKITSCMDKLMRKDRIFNLSSHGELSADSIATDCKVYSATCNLIPQSKASKNGKKSKHNNPLLDPTILLHHSQVEVGSYQMMSKSEPTGRAKANPFMYFSERYYIAPNPELEQYIADFANLISK